MAQFPDTTPSRAELRRQMRNLSRKKKPLTARERMSRQIESRTIKPAAAPKPKRRLTPFEALEKAAKR